MDLIVTSSDPDVDYVDQSPGWGSPPSSKDGHRVIFEYKRSSEPNDLVGAGGWTTSSKIFENTVITNNVIHDVGTARYSTDMYLRDEGTRYVASGLYDFRVSMWDVAGNVKSALEIPPAVDTRVFAQNVVVDTDNPITEITRVRVKSTDGRDSTDTTLDNVNGGYWADVSAGRTAGRANATTTRPTFRRTSR
jgi:hypothetical protein